MNKIDKLLEELCPEGVEYKPLGEIADYPNKRISIKEIDCYVGVENLLKDKQGVSKSGVKPDSGNAILFIPNDILIGNIRPYLKKIWLADSTGGTNGDVVLVRVNPKYDRKVNRKFLFFILSSDSFFLYDNNHAKGGKMPRGDKNKIKEYEIPLPPIEVQNEIVHILDRFTDLVVELQAKLQAELQARIQQYEYYRNKLLSFNEIGGGTQGVTWMKMNEICLNISSGGTPDTSKAEYYIGNIPWLRTQEVDWHDIFDTAIKISDSALKNSSAKMIPVNCVIVAMYGATAAKVAINKIPLCTNQACCNLEINPKIANYRFVYQWLCKEYEKLKAKGEGSQHNINGKKIKEYLIPIPSLSEQQRIIEILDRFERLTADLQTGLPAEIKARQQQYEYYRNRLLAFKRKTA